jgi:hypothetical protein
MPRYQGPADNFMLEEGGKVYHPGDNVPISRASAEHMAKVENGGHLFEGITPEARPAASDINVAKAAADKA